MTGRIVVVGGGLAAGTAVTSLRERGHEGEILVLAEEPHVPYERPPLSKGYLMGKDPAEKAQVQPAEWYDDHGVDLRTGTPVTALDPGAHTVTAGGETIPFDRLLLATGARPRHLALADDSGAPVTYLRTLDDATGLKQRLDAGGRIVVIGGGWIGLEVAAAAREAGCEVVVLEALEQPLVRVLGAEVAGIFAGLHREHGVDLRTGVQVSGIDKDGNVTLGDGSTLAADHLVVGVGVEPVTDLASAAGLTVDNGIRVDAQLRTSAPDVLAAGDVANADHPVLGHPVRVEHWDTAIKHGKVAAANLLGGDEVADALPYFFTDQYDFGMEYVGHPGPEGYEKVVVRGHRDGDRIFTAWWLRGDRVVAGMHANDWDAIDEVRRLVGTRVDVASLADEATALGEVRILGT
ncbi:MAG TPA: FAD-dependent oxidoreductase [Marmoricola sp.]|nr:FAD-dependent oxidoreductase [Marmoricola sp.]